MIQKIINRNINRISSFFLRYAKCQSGFYDETHVKNTRNCVFSKFLFCFLKNNKNITLYNLKLLSWMKLTGYMIDKVPLRLTWKMIFEISIKMFWMRLNGFFKYVIRDYLPRIEKYKLKFKTIRNYLYRKKEIYKNLVQSFSAK